MTIQTDQLVHAAIEQCATLIEQLNNQLPSIAISDTSIDDEHERIVAQCKRFDQHDGQLSLYFLTTDKTFKLVWYERWWSMMSYEERYCVVKNQSYFLNKLDVIDICNTIKQRSALV